MPSQEKLRVTDQEFVAVPRPQAAGFNGISVGSVPTGSDLEAGLPGHSFKGRPAVP